MNRLLYFFREKREYSLSNDNGSVEWCSNFNIFFTRDNVLDLNIKFTFVGIMFLLW